MLVEIDSFATGWVANVEGEGKNAPSNVLLDMVDDQVVDTR